MFFIEFTGGIVAAAAPETLGNMAKGVHSISVDVLQPELGEQQVPCVTRSPNRASDHSQAEISGQVPRLADDASASPHAENRNLRVVHDMFCALIAFALVFGVACFTVEGSVRIDGRIEFTGGIVAVAAPETLGNMAKGVHSISVDVLLRTAGLVNGGSAAASV